MAVECFHLLLKFLDLGEFFHDGFQAILGHTAVLSNCKIKCFGSVFYRQVVYDYLVLIGSVYCTPLASSETPISAFFSATLSRISSSFLSCLSTALTFFARRKSIDVSFVLLQIYKQRYLFVFLFIKINFY